LVNWQTCLRPKKLDGLGIKDLDKFGMALKLRWLWHNWDQQDKPWKHLLKITDKADRHLFFCSTTVAIRDGKNTPFWEAKWLNDSAPKYLAPNLYKVAKFKHRTIHTELRNQNWIKNLKHIDNPDLLEEFTLLFMTLTPVLLN
jgi:hypothetical protein